MSFDCALKDLKKTELREGDTWYVVSKTEWLEKIGCDSPKNFVHITNRNIVDNKHEQLINPGLKNSNFVYIHSKNYEKLKNTCKIDLEFPRKVLKTENQLKPTQSIPDTLTETEILANTNSQIMPQNFQNGQNENPEINLELEIFPVLTEFVNEEESAEGKALKRRKIIVSKSTKVNEVKTQICKTFGGKKTNEFSFTRIVFAPGEYFENIFKKSRSSSLKDLKGARQIMSLKLLADSEKSIEHYSQENYLPLIVERKSELNSSKESHANESKISKKRKATCKENKILVDINSATLIDNNIIDKQCTQKSPTMTKEGLQEDSASFTSKTPLIAETSPERSYPLIKTQKNGGTQRNSPTIDKNGFKSEENQTDFKNKEESPNTVQKAIEPPIVDSKPIVNIRTGTDFNSSGSLTTSDEDFVAESRRSSSNTTSTDSSSSSDNDTVIENDLSISKREFKFSIWAKVWYLKNDGTRQKSVVTSVKMQGERKLYNLKMVVSDPELKDEDIDDVDESKLESIVESCEEKAGFADTSMLCNQKRGLVGLNNLGHTCFMNSTIQCLSNCESLTEYFVSDSYLSHINDDNPLGWHGEIAKTFGELLKKMWMPGVQSIPPIALKTKIGEFAPRFSGYNQQDSSELLFFLLDGLHEDLNLVKKKPYTPTIEGDDCSDQIMAKMSWESHLKRNKSIIVDLFQGQTKSRVECPTCKKVSVRFEPFLALSLPLFAENKRYINFYLVGQSMMSVAHIELEVPKFGDIAELKASLCRFMSRDSNFSKQLIVSEIWKHRGYRIFHDYDLISSISPTDHIVIYEMSEFVLEDYIDDIETFIFKAKKRAEKRKAEIDRINALKKKDEMDLFGIQVSEDEEERNHNEEISISQKENSSENDKKHKIYDENHNKKNTDDSKTCNNSYNSERSNDSKESNQPKGLKLNSANKKKSPQISIPNIKTDFCLENAKEFTSKEKSKSNKSNLKFITEKMPIETDNDLDKALAEMKRKEQIKKAEKSGGKSRKKSLSTKKREKIERKNDKTDEEKIKIAENIAKRWMEEENQKNHVSVFNHTEKEKTKKESTCLESEEKGEGKKVGVFLNNFNVVVDRDGSSIEQTGVPIAVKLPKGRVKREVVLATIFRNIEKYSVKNDYDEWRRPEQILVKCQNTASSPGYFVGRRKKSIDISEVETVSIDENTNIKLIWTNSSDYDFSYFNKSTVLSENCQEREAEKTAQKYSLSDCLDEYCKTETLTAQNTWYCSKCKEQKKAIKKLDIWRLPNICVIHLKRFQQCFNIREKLEMHIEFPIEGLDLTSWVANAGIDTSNAIYDLIAISNHYGFLGGGHYTSYCKNPLDGNWYMYDDMSVTPVEGPLSQMVTSSAYVLFYQRRNLKKGTLKKHFDVV